MYILLVSLLARITMQIRGLYFIVFKLSNVSTQVLNGDYYITLRYIFSTYLFRVHSREKKYFRL